MKRQASISELWGRDVKRHRSDDESSEFSAIKKKLDHKSYIEFQGELLAQRAAESREAKERAHRRVVRESRLPGGMVDPSGKTRGVTNKNRASGRPKFSAYEQHGNKTHFRELGGPILRRDRSAVDKLSVLVAVDSKCKGTKSDGQVVRADWGTCGRDGRRELEKRFRVSWETMKLWAARRNALRSLSRRTRSASGDSCRLDRGARDYREPRGNDFKIPRSVPRPNLLIGP